jgi:hypothetical protein
MKFFFPDARDVVDPSFDFRTEKRSDSRVLLRDDIYAHEVFEKPPFDGLLLSKAIVDGSATSSGKYSMAQRQRLLRVGAKEFFRIEKKDLLTMGDCGAFSYVREERPPYTVDEVIDFYTDCGFDLGLSVDHVILGYDENFDSPLPGVDPVPPDWTRRQEITLDLADSFFSVCRLRKSCFQPMGVAQGWSPGSYARAVKQLQRIGYSYIALGGLVPLKTHEILAILKEVAKVRSKGTGLHLLGVTRCEGLLEFKRHGVRSFDSTSPLRKAFKDDKDNYFTPKRTYTAIRVPQVDGNPKLMARIQAGQVDQRAARVLEQACLSALNSFDAGQGSIDEATRVLGQYQELCEGTQSLLEVYREVLRDKPWKDCPCDVCQKLGIHVILFRGAERNRRRGFHNIFTTYRIIQELLSSSTSDGPKGKTTPPESLTRDTEVGQFQASPSGLVATSSRDQRSRKNK